MVIQTFDRAYSTINLVEVNALGEIYICRDIADGGEYSVFCMKDKALVPGLAAYLASKAKMPTFTDFVEYFVFEDKFCIATKHTQGMSLEQKLKTENASLEERLELGRKILERMVLLDMPEYFQHNCLSSRRIIVRRGMDIAFNYELSDIQHFSQTGIEDVSGAIAEIFSLLFDKELKLESAAPITEYIKNVKSGEYLGYIEFYKSYMLMAEQVKQLTEKELAEPKTFWFRLWDKIKKIVSVLKIILLIALFITVVVYLFICIDKSRKPDPTAQTFDYIGSVDISTDENSESGSDESGSENAIAENAKAQ